MVQCSWKSFKDKPWITGHLKECIKIKNNMYFKYKENKCKEDELNYQVYRKMLDKKRYQYLSQKLFQKASRQ